MLKQVTVMTARGEAKAWTVGDDTLGVQWPGQSEVFYFSIADVGQLADLLIESISRHSGFGTARKN